MSVTILHTPVLSGEARALLGSRLSGEVESCGRYFRIHHTAPIQSEKLQELRDLLPFDVNPLPPDFHPERVRLLVTDMDSTLINIECIDEIADYAGRKAEVSAVTESAMRGEIDFATSLTRRVAALEGLDQGVLLRVYEERLRLNPGAETLIAGLKSRGVRVGLVTGGFTFFTERLKERLGFDFVRANRLDIENGKLTGRVLGNIVDAEGKAAFLREVVSAMDTNSEYAIAMGDGANDLKMMEVAGLGIAYRAKPKVQAQAQIALNHSGLDAVLDLIDHA
jgi:phosphoserine phosphatase